jgi:hypothetical protein
MGCRGISMNAIIILTIPKELLEKISKNIEGSDLNAKILKCAQIGYMKLTEKPLLCKATTTTGASG